MYVYVYVWNVCIDVCTGTRGRCGGQKWANSAILMCMYVCVCVCLECVYGHIHKAAHVHVCMYVCMYAWFPRVPLYGTICAIILDRFMFMLYVCKDIRIVLVLTSPIMRPCIRMYASA